VLLLSLLSDDAKSLRLPENKHFSTSLIVSKTLSLTCNLCEPAKRLQANETATDGAHGLCWCCYNNA